LGLSDDTPLLLASASPRRRELLASVGLPLVVDPVGADESEREGEPPEVYLERVVRAKLHASRDRAAGSIAARLVADTIVVADGRVLGKPRDRAEAIEIVSALSGRAHEVKTRFHVERVGPEPQRELARTVTTRVHVRELPRAWIERYADTGEGSDKAGAYAIQGRFAFAVERVEGSYTNVVGLPLCEVVAALDGLGLIPRFLAP
jgi:septum formation protein